MAVTMSQVEWVDVDKAEELDAQEEARWKAAFADSAPDGNMNYESVCGAEAGKYVGLLNRFLAVHIICFLACLSREIFCTKTDWVGQIMRIMEIACIPLYFSSIF